DPHKSTRGSQRPGAPVVFKTRGRCLCSRRAHHVCVSPSTRRQSTARFETERDHRGSQMTNEEIHQLAQRLRIDSVRAAAAANSGHPTSSMSAADLMAVLMARHLRYDYSKPENPNNDHLIFSKGHASPLVYAMFVAAGVVTDEELLTFRQFGSKLEGHPTPILPW